MNWIYASITEFVILVCWIVFKLLVVIKPFQFQGIVGLHSPSEVIYLISITHYPTVHAVKTGVSGHTTLRCNLDFILSSVETEFSSCSDELIYFIDTLRILFSVNGWWSIGYKSKCVLLAIFDCQFSLRHPDILISVFQLFRNININWQEILSMQLFFYSWALIQYPESAFSPILHCSMRNCKVSFVDVSLKSFSELAWSK